MTSWWKGMKMLHGTARWPGAIIGGLIRGGLMTTIEEMSIAGGRLGVMGESDCYVAQLYRILGQYGTGNMLSYESPRICWGPAVSKRLG
jgi:hypothetical protein